MKENDEKNITENVEQPDGEIKEETVKKVHTIEKYDADSEPYFEVIENARKALYEKYTKSRKVSNILTVVVLAVAVVGMILITQKDSALTLTGWLLVGATVIGLLVYYALTKNKFPNDTREYIGKITNILNQNNFSNDKFTELSTDPSEKIDLPDLIGDDVYDGVGSVGSRNVVRGKFANRPFLYGEIGLTKINATKKDAPIFVGKYISLTNSLELKGRIIITLKKQQNAVDLPTKTAGLDVLESTDDIMVYGLKNCDYKKVLGSKFLSDIKSLMPKDHLLNVNIVIWGGKTGLYLSYDDATMVLPFDKPFDRNTNDQVVENMIDALEANEDLGK